MHSGRVDQYDLSGFAALLMRRLLLRSALLRRLRIIDDAENAVAGSLRLWRNDGELLADQRIEQRALTRVGTAEDADETGVKGHVNRVQGFKVSRFQVSHPRFSIGSRGCVRRSLGSSSICPSYRQEL